MTRLPIRIRLTAAFALAMVLLLVAAGAFVYVRLEQDLDEAISDGLIARAQAVVESDREGRGPDPDVGAPREREEGFAQLLDRRGAVIKSSAGYNEPVLEPEEAARASDSGIELTREVGGVDGSARILALAIEHAARARVVVIGQSLEDRDETLANLVASFALGGPVAVLLASLLGYALASRGLAPVEAMRRRAAEISLDRREVQLPLPRAGDEVRRLGETLNEMLARLRESFERERRFVADASHELRTPITVIKAELDAALRSGDLGPDSRRSVAAAIEECDSLAALAEDMLVLARAADGELPVERERLDLAELLEGVRTRFSERAAERGRQLRTEVEPGLAIDGDPLRLRQALGNLVDNALRHGAGEVVLRAGRRGEEVELSVADEGPGLDPTIAASAFERFTRADAARSGGGAGLGLAIVRAVAEAHGGTAEIGSQERGAIVRVRLLVEADSASQADLSAGA